MESRLHLAPILSPIRRMSQEMNQTLKVLPLASALLLAVVLSSGHHGLAGAQEASKPIKTARGGTLTKAGRHQFEFFFFTTGLRVFT
jgi:hypothetical protein